jgi:DNA-binding NarL/FixJ family response regulator
MANSARPRLLLVDDHHLLLDGLRQSLQDEYEIVGMVSAGTEVAGACRRLTPDLVLLDLSLPDRSGLEVIDDLKVGSPAVKILVVTMHLDRVLAEASIQAGAHGFVPKDAGLDELRLAIREVLAGREFVSALVPHTGPRVAAATDTFQLDLLTPRQREIVHLLGDGKSTDWIAKHLHISPWTVTFHRTRIRKALGIDDEWGLLRYALVVRMSEAEAHRPHSHH